MESLVKAVGALGYEEPTPVQQATIPVMLAGEDLLAQAATGTGKTAAFALPMIHRLAEQTEPPAGRKSFKRVPRGLVLVPTRRTSRMWQARWSGAGSTAARWTR